MKQQLTRRGLSLLLAVALCISLVPLLPANAAGSALGMDAIKELANAETLYPQPTGYAALDAKLEEIFAPYENSDNYTKLKVAYDWAVHNISYSWAGYSGSSYSSLTVTYPYDDYDDSLIEAIPFLAVSRTWHVLTNRKGVCYEWATVLAVMLRYVGFETYIHTGYFTFESGYGTGSGAHGWTEVVLGGQNYIFDAQREYRLSANGTGTVGYYYFGIPYANAWRYSQDTSANAARDAEFLPVSTSRVSSYTISAVSSRSGSVSGTGEYAAGDTVTLTAQSASGRSFQGWYTASGTLLSTDATLSFSASASVTVIAMFQGDVFFDLAESDWYYETVLEALTTGVVVADSIRFDGTKALTRAETVTLLARISGMNYSVDSSCPFTDLPADEEQAAAICWAWRNSITSGRTETTFDPEASVTRQEFLVLLMRLLTMEGITAGVGIELPFTDTAEIDDYALSSLTAAYALGLVSGYPDGSVQPDASIDRGSGVSLVMRASQLFQTGGNGGFISTGNYVQPSAETETEATFPDAASTDADTASGTGGAQDASSTLPTE